jgi:hypothetical protein
VKLSEIRQALTALFAQMADKARRDARSGEVDLSQILGIKPEDNEFKLLDKNSVDETIAAINKLTRTKDGARRLVAVMTVAIKHAASLI